ncbi:MAG: hypothetical protein CBB79_02965 [Synechococcus sp. TMED19]|nr:MAG: hypothetical protein CBB79_02965 [Synechococcus sp. TMED19]
MIGPVIYKRSKALTSSLPGCSAPPPRHLIDPNTACCSRVFSGASSARFPLLQRPLMRVASCQGATVVWAIERIHHTEHFHDALVING